MKDGNTQAHISLLHIPPSWYVLKSSLNGLHIKDSKKMFRDGSLSLTCSIST